MAAVWLLAASPAMRLALPAVAPTMRMASPVMNYVQRPPEGPQTAQVGGPGNSGNGAPPQGMTLQQKVETLCNELSIQQGRSLAETVETAVRELGLEKDVAALNLGQKVDACMSITMGTQSEDSSMMDERNQPIRGPQPLGYGGSYETYMFGDVGFGGVVGGRPIGWGGYPYRGRYLGYSYDPYSYWSGGYSGYGYYPYSYGYGGGFGSYGYGGTGGLRPGSAAERALARAARQQSGGAVPQAGRQGRA